MRQYKKSLFFRLFVSLLLCVFCSSILTYLVLLILIGLGKVEMSDFALGTLGSVAVALINLMAVTVKEVGRKTLRED
ncbi:hypothetical protein NFK84_08865 [Enterobacter ludwigii]|jgi:hypothetical protein|uniref:hypothetical protein n=1 Tax=Enterobacter ludwigii TaxID=299767 RepID=UPI00242BEEC2|nr:hypothetical protein [Enterobacter ludwigii]WGA06413.1 hypothetical protein NFK84_08865 [Enterobacter ludwigii]